MFPDDDEDDKRSYQSEEAIKSEEMPAQLNPEQIAKLKNIKHQKEQEKLEALGSEMREKFGMQEFDIEIKKI